MTRATREQRDALTLLIATRERNDEAVRGMETDRARLVAHGGLITSPLWRRWSPASTDPGAAFPDLD